MSIEIKKEIQLEIAHVLFIDIVGYSKLLINEQSEQLETLKKIVRGTEQFRLAEAEGKLLRLPTGDGGALVFRTSPEAPVLCALEISEELKKHPELHVRMGIHSGPVNAITDLNEQANIAGAGINTAERVMDCGDAGHILVSKHVAEDLEHYARWRAHLHELGECEVKHGVRVGVVNFYGDGVGNPRVPKKLRVLNKQRARVRWMSRAAAVLLIVASAVAFVFGSKKSARLFQDGYTAGSKTTASSPKEIPNQSIAVLPFDNLSRDPENAYFSEGIQDEILTRLAKIAELKVVSRTSTQKYKSAPDNLRDIAQRLGVANILEGSVQKAGDQVRVTVQLINALSDTHLWADTYDRKLTDIFSVESEIARTVAETLQAKLTGSAKQALASRPTENPEAHELYLKGRYFWNRRTEENLKKALGYFQQAIEKDPSYALAYSGMADCYALMPVYSSNPPKEDIQRAIAAARRALQLDDNLAEAHTSLGNALNTDSKFAGAEVEFRRAIALNPNYATLHQWFAECLQAQGRFEEALVEAQRAYDLDPLSLIINAILASVLDCAGRYDEALQQIHRTIDMDPNFGVAYWVLGQILENKGDLKGAADAYEKAEQAVPSPLRLAVLASVYARINRSAEARKILNELTAKSQRRFVPSYPIALIHVALGDNEQALQLLEKAYDERSIQIGGNTGSLKIDKRLDPLRSEPRFQKLLARSMGNAQ
jgi:TolB-like protein/Tfp pilus assembly protein PilF